MSGTRPRRGWLAPALLATVIVEFVVFVLVAQWIGFGWTFVAAVALSIVGVVLLRREGLRGWQRFQERARSGQPPGPQVTDGLVGMFGAVLVTVPGFVTALIGLLVVLPPGRIILRRQITASAQRRMGGRSATEAFGPRKVRVQRGEPVDVPAQPAPSGAAIEGEIVEK